MTALLDHTTVLGLELRPLDQLAGQQLGVAGLDDRHAAQHLPDDDLDVLVVDRHALRVVDLLDLADQVDLDGTLTQDAQHVVRVGGTHGELLAHLDVLALGDQDLGALRDRVRRLVAAVVRGDDELLRLLRLLDPHAAGGLGDRGDTLRGTGLEELDDTRQTLGDVVTGHTTGVEGTHRQLGAGLTDGLGGDDADRLTDVDQLARGQRTAVAHRAGADGGLAGQDRAGLDLLDAALDELLDEDVAQVGAGRGQHLPVDDDVLGEAARVHGRLDVALLAEHSVRVPARDLETQTAVGAAVLLADDDVLGDVDQTTGEVTRVGGTQSGVRQTLTGTVRGDEVLQHGQALTERRLDRTRDGLVLRVRHQTTHTGNLTHLHHVASCTRVHHHEDRVGLREVVVHRLGDAVLAFLREYEDDLVLCVNNFSRFAQPTELDLSAFEGRHPVELFGGVRFPAVGELPYLMTLGGHGFYWFRLRKDAA